MVGMSGKQSLTYTTLWERSITDSINNVYEQYKSKQFSKPVDTAACWHFYNTTLGAAKYIAAPMVNQSELPFRMLCRLYSTQLCYTPMINSKQFVASQTYRDIEFTTCAEDRPLIVQFAGNDADILLQAVQMIENNGEHLADAVDINMGCPQGIARRGVYGAYLMYRPDLVAQIVSTLYQHCSLPITCKIRLFADYSNTLKFAQILQMCGCSMLTVHGRTKEQNKQTVGMNNFQQIQQLKRDLQIPVIGNGGVATLDDVHRILADTGVDGVMSSEALLSNPALFANKHIDAIQMSRAYLQLTEQYRGADSSCIRAHLFKLLHHRLSLNTAVRNKLGTCKPSEFVALLDELAADTTYIQPDMYSRLHWYHRHIVAAEKHAAAKAQQQMQNMQQLLPAQQRSTNNMLADTCNDTSDVMEPAQQRQKLTYT